MVKEVRQPLRRGIALGAATAMTALALVAVAPSGHGATGQLSYSCSLWGAVAVDTDSDVSPRIHVGDTTTPTVTSVVTLPDSVRAPAHSGGARWVTGTVTAEGDVNGAPLQPITLTIPLTAVPDSGTLPLTAVGVTAPLPTVAPGDLALHAGGLSATIQFYDASEEAWGDPVADSCARPPGQPPTIDTVVVAARSTTTLSLVRATGAYGEDLAPTAKVTTTGGSPDGDVAFVVDGVATAARIDRDGVATTSIRGLRTGAHSVSATFLPRDALHYDGTSTAAQSVSVTKASTRTGVAVTGKLTTRPTRVAATVKAAFGTTATGKVRFKLVRQGTRQRWVKVKTLDKGQRTVGFGRLKKGRYQVIVTYRGDANHARSRTVKRFRVTRA